MKYAVVLPIAFVLTNLAVGQVTYQKPLQIDPTSCRVGLQVRHGSGFPVSVGAAGLALNGEAQGGKVPPSVYNQAILLTLANPGSQDIVNFEITVHGLSEKWRYVPMSDMPQKPDFSKTVSVSLDVKGSGHASRDLFLSHFTAVTSVDLNSIRYADGSEWQAQSGACRVTPDLIMLVATR
jgi:hypothetical protein